MAYDSNRPNRRSIRLKNYDYAQPGVYFVTLCVQDYHCLLGRIGGGEMILNDMGKIVTNTWEWLGQQYDHVDLDAYVAMPNHFHGIIVLSETGRGGSRTAPTISRHKNTPDGKTTSPKRKLLGRLVGSFKTVSTKRINRLRQMSGVSFWQRNYWEHVIRNEHTLEAVRRYINQNPMRWDLGHYNPNARELDPLAKELWLTLKSSIR